MKRRHPHLPRRRVARSRALPAPCFVSAVRIGADRAAATEMRSEQARPAA